MPCQFLTKQISQWRIRSLRIFKTAVNLQCEIKLNLTKVCSRCLRTATRPSVPLFGMANAQGYLELRELGSTRMLSFKKWRQMDNKILF
jgi:hypothetical protein